ncbi:Hsp20/alpha crystallin family protein [Streptomyces noursei]|uniref:Hsp20/alpha crystallin family protein n=1 Tax=Streptomyces noursei TaxID=1971 RepID=UPI0019658C0F|nr:Hsp20/alpha crystallin family protein [Streptomyces noursei]QRX90264.1 Hsp20/alpha crystallin family protein [Streptomyces noursei]
MTLPVRHRPGWLLERHFPTIRWEEPFAAEFSDLFQRMNQFLENAGDTPSMAGAWVPPADMHETDDTYVVEAELPGIKREDIDVEVGERQLHITGEYKECEREGVLRRSTRRTGRFEYRALLPTEVKADDITANLTDGILTVTIPKSQGTRPRHIEITQS